MRRQAPRRKLMKFYDKKSFKIFALILIIFSIIFAACAVYVSNYYEANDAEIEAFMPQKTTEVYEKGYISFGNTDSNIGFIFYPGGKVEHTAYIPLMRALAGKGLFCVLFEMPFKLAVLNSDAADGICDKYPGVESWFIGGHSLGGSMAASYISDNIDKFDGLILLGSYSTADLSDSMVSVLSVYGSEDKVMNFEKYEKNKENLPSDFKEVVISGGCHAYFGMYGEQNGDGNATVSPEEQIIMTTEEIFSFTNEKQG